MALEVRAVISPRRVRCDWEETLGAFWGALMVCFSI